MERGAWATQVGLMQSQVPLEQEGGRRRLEHRDGRQRGDGGKTAAGFEGGKATGQGIQGLHIVEAGKGEKRVSSQALEEAGPCQHLDFSPAQ